MTIGSTAMNGATKAMDQLIESCGMLTLAYSNASPGTRLMAMQDSLNSVQQRLSRVYALITMYPDLALQFEPGTAYDVNEQAEIDALNEAVAISIPEQLPVVIECEVHDGRLIARELEDGFRDRRLIGRWDPNLGLVRVDVSPLIEPLLDQIDPHGEDVPGYWGDDEGSEQ